MEQKVSVNVTLQTPVFRISVMIDFESIRRSRDMKKDPAQVTKFQERVYETLRKIPKGKVTTYKELARALGCGSSQAVGQALKCNPFAPEVPCHRVIRSDLTIGGFSGATGGPQIERKKALLAAEGVRFEGDRLADPGNVYRFTPTFPRSPD
jgi:methylated-DNA-[protein]-cysteine S-methyltransferase